MAVCVPYNYPTTDPQFFDRLRKYLILQPKAKFFPSKYSKFRPLPPSPINFYINCEGHIRIPYAYASMMLGKAYNTLLPHPKVNLSINPGKELREHQVSVVQESLQNLANYGTNSIICRPGFGKTGMTCFISVALNYVTCVLTHRRNILKQWLNSYRMFTNANIWVVGEETYFHPNGGGEKAGINVIICMKDRVKHIPAEVIDKIGFLVIDEVHRFCTPSCVEPILSFRPRFVMACTATIDREDGLDSMVLGLCGAHRVVREFTGKFYYKQIHTGIAIDAPQNKNGNGIKFDVLLKNMGKSEQRNNMILALVKANPDKKIMIATTLVEDHAQIIFNVLKAAGEDVTLFAGDSEFFDARVCVLSTGRGAEGFDVNSIMDDPTIKQYECLINITSFKSVLLWTQLVGRVLRVDTSFVIDLVDNHPTLQNHGKYRRKWCLENGGYEP
jgi:superfamily II DNA or RNA helicase